MTAINPRAFVLGVFVPSGFVPSSFVNALGLVALLLVGACSNSQIIAREGGGGTKGAGGAGGSPVSRPACTPQAATETACSDGVDDDCDGYTDCLDPDCEAQACGSGAGLSCTAGACLKPGDGMLPAVPKIDNVRVTMRGDTAIVDFEPVANALDYRIYPMPAPADILVGANGELAVRNAIYRCAGDRPVVRREDDQAGLFAQSLSGVVHGYKRAEAEALLGYVYLTPAAGRLPVYRVSNPDLPGGYSWDYLAPPRSEFNGADYVLGDAARDGLVAKGWRDDGVAFYVPADGTLPLYRREYVADTGGSRTSVFYVSGAEHDARAGDSAGSVADFGERFKIAAAPVAAQGPSDGTVPLRRVYYSWANAHDVLVAGDARYQEALHQGNQALPSVMWPGLAAGTTLVVEALDAGCPFPGGYIGANHAVTTDPTRSGDLPTLTLDEARLPSGEVFVNGQHEGTNRPRPIARAYVPVTPEAPPKMDWFQSFDPGAAWEPFTKVVDDNIGTQVYRNSKLSAEFSSCYMCNHSFGPVLGELFLGSATPTHLAARGVDPQLAPDRFLHVRMDTDIPATARRYPQIWITTTPVVEPADVAHSYDVPIASRLGPWPFQMLPPGADHTIVVQPFGYTHELQIEFCDLRGWGVSQQCPRANLYGSHAGSYEDTWVSKWLPVPVLGDLAGADRLVRFDVYASTKRVYVFVEGRPGGCAVLPEGRMPAGPVTVVFGSAAYHIEIDESVVPDTSPHQYWHRYSVTHVDRHMDNLGIDLSVPAPAWDESVLPCGTRWYGGSN